MKKAISIIFIIFFIFTITSCKSGSQGDTPSDTTTSGEAVLTTAVINETGTQDIFETTAEVQDDTTNTNETASQNPTNTQNKITAAPTIKPTGIEPPKTTQAQPKNGVIIYEIYTAGGYVSTGENHAPYKYNYVVLYNSTDNAINLNGWVLLFLRPDSGKVMTENSTPLSGEIKAKGYFVIRGGQALDAPKPPTGGELPFKIDIEGTFATERKVGIIALCTKDKTGTVLPTDPDVSDYLGFGKNAIYYMGSAPATGITVKRVLRRNSLNTTGDNKKDFTLVNIFDNPSDVIIFK